MAFEKIIPTSAPKHFCNYFYDSNSHRDIYKTMVDICDHFRVTTPQLKINVDNRVAYYDVFSHDREPVIENIGVIDVPRKNIRVVKTTNKYMARKTPHRGIPTS